MTLLLRFFVALSLLLLFTGKLQATHIIGGEVSYKSLGNDQYEFTVKIYRDCYNGIADLDDPAFFTVFDAANNIVANPAVFLLLDTLIPPSSTNPCLIAPPNVCVEEGTYIFTLTLPYSEGGYSIVYQRCCRNGSIVNLNGPGSTGATYAAFINDSSLVFHNSSPIFGNYPPIVICASLPLSFDHSAFDTEGDSLVYHLCEPLRGASSFSSQPPIASSPPFIPVTFISPYSYSNPLDGSPPLHIDSITGLLTATPTAVGQYVVGICVEEYRKGVFLGEHQREFQFNVVNCQLSVVASIPAIINNCETNSITFQNFSVGGSIYHWDFGVAVSNSDTSNLKFPTFVFPDTGSYKVTLAVNPNSPCFDTASSRVLIYPALKADDITPDGCQQVGVQFTDISTSGTGKVNSWKWSFGDSGFSQDKNPLHSYANPGNYNTRLIVTTNKGCIDTVDRPIIIHPTPQVIATPKDTIICSIQDVHLFANVQNAGSYKWLPNYNISSTTDQNPTVSPDVTTTYHLTGTSIYGCIGYDSIKVVAFDSIYAHAGKDTVICPGGSAQLKSSVYASSYKWLASSSLSNTQIPNPVATPLITTRYILTATAGSCLASDTVLVSVKPVPTINAGPGQNICEGDTTFLSASGCTSYSWNPLASLDSPLESFTAAHPIETTAYFVTGTDSTKCPISATDSALIVVGHPQPGSIKRDTTIVIGTSGKLWVNGGISFTWYPAEGLSDVTVADPVADPTITTTYHVSILSANGCRKVDSIVVRVVYDPIVQLPNAFTPNGDSNNDYFRPIIVGGVSNLAFKVYNRWGQLLFETDDIHTRGWDGMYKGAQQEIGSYAYMLVGIATSSGKAITMHGNVTLIR